MILQNTWIYHLIKSQRLAFIFEAYIALRNSTQRYANKGKNIVKFFKLNQIIKNKISI